ncbi:Ig-like domain-containing protein, partial [Litorivicinus sp.]|nr:Ig-like domain-containing protein [Litorivicinus sp.]
MSRLAWVLIGSLLSLNLAHSASVPVAVPDTVTTAEDTPVVIDVLDNDTDADNDTLSVLNAVVTDSDAGTVTNNGNDITFTPALNYSGSATVLYFVSDSNDGADSSSVTITVTAVNDAPVVNAATATIAEDAAQQTYPVTTSATYASDVESDGLTITAATLSGDTTGSLNFSDGANILYTPSADFNGTATINYTLEDDGTTGGSANPLTGSGT